MKKVYKNKSSENLVRVSTNLTVEEKEFLLTLQPRVSDALRDLVLAEMAKRGSGNDSK